MDNQQPTPQIPETKSLLTTKNILIFFGVVIVLELIWAGLTLLKPAARSTTQTVPALPQITTISLSAPKTDLKVGESIVVSINITSDKQTVGTDLVITYDPKLLTVTAAGTSPVTSGTLYSDYPLNKLDKNRITVSGITDKAEGVLGNGLFGSVVFQAKEAGVAEIMVDFTPGKTTDANIIESGTSQDVLEKVNNLMLTISK